MSDCWLLLTLWLLAFETKLTAASQCPHLCKCSPPLLVACTLKRFDQLVAFTRANVTELIIDVWPPDEYPSNGTHALHTVRRLRLPSRHNPTSLSNLLRDASLVSLVHVKSSGEPLYSFPRELLQISSLQTLIVEGELRRCVYDITRHSQPSLSLCNDTCDRQGTLQWNHGGDVCVCQSCQTVNDSVTVDNSSVANATGNATYAGSGSSAGERYIHTVVIGLLGALALFVNFFFITRTCTARPMTPLSIFALGLFLFDCCIAEYGIAVAAFLSQEDTHWNKKFCSGVVSLKIFGLAAATASLFLMTYQKVISADMTITKQNLIFKAIVYVMEGMMFGGMLGIISWTKFTDWSYLCTVVHPRTTVDKMLVGIEATCFLVVPLLFIRYPYHRSKHHCSPEKQNDNKRKTLMPRYRERDFPISFLLLVTVLVWSIGYLCTVPAVIIHNEHSIAFLRTCSLLLGALLHPILFSVRSYIRCECAFCNCLRCPARDSPRSRDARCDCKGAQMCPLCNGDAGPGANYGHRRRSLSLDDLKLPKTPTFSLDVFKTRRIKATSKSYPLLSSPIDEEEIDGGGGSRNIKSITPASPSMPEFLSTYLSGNHSSEDDAPEIMYSNVRGCASLPLLDKQRPQSRGCHKGDSREATPKGRKLSTPLKIVVVDTTVTTDADRQLLLKEAEATLSRPASSSSEADRNRISRVPTFIPFDEPGPSGVAKSRDNNARSPVREDTRKAPLAKFSYSSEFNQENDEDSDEALDARVAERQPFCKAIAEEPKVQPSRKSSTSSEGQSKRKTKHHKGRSGKGRGSRPTTKSKGRPCEELVIASASMDSLEWDPSISNSETSSPLPNDSDAITSPVPPITPSKYAMDVLKQSRNSDSSFSSQLARNSHYSMDWDPTGVQRVRDSAALQCDWEPYSVDEPPSNGEQPPEKSKTEEIPYATTENL